MVRKLESVWGAEEHQGLFPAYQSNCSSLCRSGHKLKWVRVTAFCGMVFNATKSCQRCSCSQIAIIASSFFLFFSIQTFKIWATSLQRFKLSIPSPKHLGVLRQKHARMAGKSLIDMTKWRLARGLYHGVSRPGSCNSPILVGLYSEIEMNY